MGRINTSIYECELMDDVKNLTIFTKELAIEKLGVAIDSHQKVFYRL